METEEKKEKVMEAIGKLNWFDISTAEVMEGFFNNPLEAVECAKGEMSEEHIDYLFDLLNCDDDFEFQEEEDGNN